MGGKNTMSYSIHELLNIEKKSTEFKTLKEFQNWLAEQIEIEDKAMSEYYKKESKRKAWSELLSEESHRVEKWCKHFDGNDPEVLLTAVLNNRIKTEVMIDSILAYEKGDIIDAQEHYNNMWRKNA
tara:strand:- start:386 stop:763 length:378 start_codon:yes stop_codon:yes gene_type:complete